MLHILAQYRSIGPLSAMVALETTQLGTTHQGEPFLAHRLHFGNHFRHRCPNGSQPLRNWHGSVNDSVFGACLLFVRSLDYQTGVFPKCFVFHDSVFTKNAGGSRKIEKVGCLKTFIGYDNSCDKSSLSKYASTLLYTSSFKCKNWLYTTKI